MLLEITVSTERTTDEAALIKKGTKFCGLEETAGGKKTTSRFFEPVTFQKHQEKKKKKQIMEEMRSFAPEGKKGSDRNGREEAELEAGVI